MNATRYLLAMTVSLMSAGPVLAAPCKEPEGRAATSRKNCPPPPRKVEPYDPERLRVGSRPGFIDVGGGTEIRVGGRARMEYGTAR